ncbi:hypothetical protein K443DRAFT_106778 [Laccaria amethystina LaAM-08-1]|uniref:Uncharacterized protein n=1 Tax=Laccaria amethystina LaAM-08-1 TaxID=1095629 RepID=A0A0C9WVZ3_9AGAR|nr:hypothetical protein K443DRAFT_106778 [Laccaria amethystina LaAM-08-1]
MHPQLGRIQVGSIVRFGGGHDPEHTTGCSKTEHLSLPLHSFARHVYGGWLRLN